MITKILATTAVISFSLTATAFAQDKSADKPKPSATDSQTKIGGNDPIPGIDIIVKKTEPANAMATGSDGEDRIMENVTANHKTDGLGAIIAIGAVKDTGGEDRLTENVTTSGGGGGKVNVQDINIIEYAKDPKLGPIKGESQEKAMGGGSGAGKANFQDLSLASSPSGGEDRLTENVTLNFGIKEAPACVTESGAADANCDGAPDSDATNKDTKFDRRDIRKRPEPRQQRR